VAHFSRKKSRELETFLKKAQTFSLTTKPQPRGPTAPFGCAMEHATGPINTMMVLGRQKPRVTNNTHEKLQLSRRLFCLGVRSAHELGKFLERDEDLDQEEFQRVVAGMTGCNNVNKIRSLLNAQRSAFFVRVRILLRERKGKSESEEEKPLPRLPKARDDAGKWPCLRTPARSASAFVPRRKTGPAKRADGKENTRRKTRRGKFEPSSSEASQAEAARVLGISVELYRHLYECQFRDDLSNDYDALLEIHTASNKSDALEPDAIARLPRLPCPSEDEGHFCAICQDIFLSIHTLIRLPCCEGHKFHEECIAGWLSHSVLCPLDKQDIRLCRS